MSQRLQVPECGVHEPDQLRPLRLVGLLQPGHGRPAHEEEQKPEDTAKKYQVGDPTWQELLIPGLKVLIGSPRLGKNKSHTQNLLQIP